MRCANLYKSRIYRFVRNQNSGCTSLVKLSEDHCRINNSRGISQGVTILRLTTVKKHFKDSDWNGGISNRRQTHWPFISDCVVVVYNIQEFQTKVKQLHGALVRVGLKLIARERSRCATNFTTKVLLQSAVKSLRKSIIMFTWSTK